MAANPLVYMIYITSDRHGAYGIGLHATRRGALLELLDVCHDDDEMILNDEKINALSDDALADAVSDYAATRGYDWYIDTAPLPA